MLLYLIARILQMGWRHLAFSCLVPIAIVAALYLIFGTKAYSGPVLVVISLVCTGLLIMFSMPIVFSLGIGCSLFLVLFKDYPHQIMHTEWSEASILSSVGSTLFHSGRRASEYRRRDSATGRIGESLSRFRPWWPGMVTVLGEYFFSGISGSTVADVSAIGSIMVPALKKAGYKSDESVSIVSAASAMGMLVRPLSCSGSGRDNRDVRGSPFCGWFHSAMVLMACIMVLIYIQAVRSNIAVEKTHSV